MRSGFTASLTAIAMEVTMLAKACGKSSVHNLEVEDLRALSFEASAFTGVKMAGLDRGFYVVIFNAVVRAHYKLFGY